MRFKGKPISAILLSGQRSTLSLILPRNKIPKTNQCPHTNFGRRVLQQGIRDHPPKGKANLSGPQL